MGIKRVFVRTLVVLALLTGVAASGIAFRPDQAPPPTKEAAKYLPSYIGYAVDCDTAAGMHVGTVQMDHDGDILQYCIGPQGSDQAFLPDLNRAVKAAERRRNLKVFLLTWLGAMGALTTILFAADWVARGAGRGFLFDKSPPQGAKLASWLGATGLLGCLALGYLLDLPEWVLWFPILFLILADHFLASRGIATRWVRYPSVLLVFVLVMIVLNLALSLVSGVVLSGDPHNKDSKFIVSVLPLVSWVVSFFAARAYAKWMARRAPRPWLPVASASDAGTA